MVFLDIGALRSSPTTMDKCSSGKKTYYSEYDAEEALIDAWGRNNYREGSGPLAVYACTECRYFHWTSRPPINEKLKKALEDGSILKEQEANKWRTRF